MSSLDVEIYSDIICPWCFIGKRRFEAALAEVAATDPDLEVIVTYRPYLLDPTAPTDGTLSVRDGYAAKFGGPAKADAILAKLTEEGATEGLDFRFDIGKRSNTIDAHRLMILARSVGLEPAMNERLMAAYFSEGVNLGDRAELARLAGEVGIDAAEATAWLDSDGGRDDVAAELEEAAERGVSAVPTFVFNNEFAVPGAQSPEFFGRVLRKLANAEG